MKPCPFCGERLEWCIDLCGFAHPYDPFCVASDVLIIGEAVIERWNTRTPDPMLEALAVALEKACDSVCELIDNSCGVEGLHMNGDVAPWHDLRSGGRYEGWLVEFDEALELLQKYQQSKVQQ